MNTISCNAVTDLMPLYIEGLTSDKTNNEINNHIKECNSCKNLFSLQSIKLCENNEFVSESDKKVYKKINKIGLLFIAKFLIILVICFFAAMCFNLFYPNNIVLKYSLLLLSGVLGYVLLKKIYIPIISYCLIYIFAIMSSVKLNILVLPVIILIYILSYLTAYSINQIFKNRKTIKCYFKSFVFIICLIFIIFSSILDYAINSITAISYIQIHYSHLNLKLDSIKFSPEKNLDGVYYFVTDFKDNSGKVYTIFLRYYDVVFRDPMVDW